MQTRWSITRSRSSRCMTGRQQAFVLPRRAFASDAETLTVYCSWCGCFFLVWGVDESCLVVDVADVCCLLAVGDYVCPTVSLCSWLGFWWGVNVVFDGRGGSMTSVTVAINVFCVAYRWWMQGVVRMVLDVVVLLDGNLQRFTLQRAGTSILCGGDLSARGVPALYTLCGW